MIEFRKNKTEVVRVSIDQFNGRDLISLRVWYQTDDGEWRPGKQGLALRLELLPDLQAALAKVAEVGQ